MSEIVVTQSTASISPDPPLADCSPAQQIELRYLNAANALLDDAVEHESARILVDVLTWILARMIVGYGTSFVAGDILRRLGAHISTLAERRYAQEEAAQERANGHAPH